MENKDMNVIVNLGEYKIFLQADEDGVTGGYIDSEGNTYVFEVEE